MEAVGIEASFMQAIRSACGGGRIGFVGVAHEGVRLPMDERRATKVLLTL